MVTAKTLTIFDILSWAIQELQGGLVLSPQVEAEIIVGNAVGLSRAELYLNRQQAVAKPELEFIKKAVADRTTGKPLQYILGHQQFRYLDLVCWEGVLIPRPETELLVEKALDELNTSGGFKNVLDIGCGTGAIAISIASEYRGASVYASDISAKALLLTKENARLAGVLDRVVVVKADIFAGLEDIKGELDMVVSNPPYIPSSDLSLLQREVQFEPRVALDGGEDGLDLYRAIIEDAPGYLKSGGVLLFEIGIEQTAQIADLIKSTGRFADIEVFKDYAGIERIIKARRI